MFSLYDFLALVALLSFAPLLAGICSQEQCISALREALEAAGDAIPSVGIVTDYRGDYEAAKDTIRGLRATIANLRDTIGRLEGLAHPCDHHHDFAALQQTILGLQRQLAVAESDLKRSRSAASENSARIRALLAEQQVQLDAAGVEQAKIARLERTIVDQNTSLWQLNVVRAQFDHVKGLIHQLVAAGGIQMVVTILFVGLLAHFGGIDLAGLGVDHLKFESYFEYARALADGLPCPLLPQDGCRLEGIQYPLSGLRVVGSRIVEPFTTFLAAGSAASPHPVALSAPLPSSAPEQSALPLASRPVAASAAAAASTSTSQPRPVPASATTSSRRPAGPASTSATSHPRLAGPISTPANATSRPRPAGPASIPRPAVVASSGSSLDDAMPALAPVAPSRPAQNQTVSLGFQATKKPGSFGVRK